MNKPSAQSQNESLNKANERFELIAKATHDTIWDWDLRTNALWWNENFQHMFGYSREETGDDILSWSSRIHPDDIDAVIRGVHEVIDNGGTHWEGEYRFRRSDGSYVDVFDRGYTLHDEQGPYRMVGSMLDITERKRSQRQLAESEDRLRIAIEATGLGTWDLNPNTGVLQWDSRCKELFGLPPDAWVDYSVFLSGLHPDDRDRTDRTVQKAFDPHSGGHYDIEYRTIGIKDGKLRWVAAKGRALFNEKNEPYRFIGTVLDITPRKTAETNLRSSEEKLKEALLVADTGTWKIDLQTGVDFRDESLNRILGLEAKETTRPLTDLFTKVHPEDEKRMRLALDKAISEKGNYSEECRIYRPDGSMRWIRDRGKVVVDEEGHALYVIGAATDITDLKEKEERISINEERFREIFDNSFVGMAIADLNGKLIDANPEMKNITGYSKEELLAMNVVSLNHPQYHDQTREQLRSLILGEEPHYSAEKRYLRKDGSTIWVNISVAAVRDKKGVPKHFIGLIQDINDRKLAEESLKMQALVLESMDEGVSIADESGFILYTNEAEDAMFGYEPEELIGKHVSVQNAYSEEENERIVGRVMEILQRDGYWNGEWHNRRKDGSSFYTYAHIIALDLGDRRVLVCVQRDITEEKATKEALQRSHEELEMKVAARTRELLEAAERLERSNQELEQFAYVASHDLQEPLRKIKIFAHRIGDEVKPLGNERINTYLDKLIVSSERMSTLIRDLLNYSKLSQKEHQFVPVDLNEIVGEVLTDFEMLIQQKGASVVYDKLPTVSGIPLQLNQLVYNLVGNSLKFSKPSVEPQITIRHRLLQAEEAAAEGLPSQSFHEILFIDNGIGFSPRYKEQVFEIFQRLHTREQFAGTGIGLALSRRVVDNHHGYILAEPEEGVGTTFRIFLPAGDDEAAN